MLQIKDQMDIIIESKLVVMVLAIPLIVALLFGYIFANNQILETDLAVIDLDNSSYSRQLTEKLDASPYIRVSQVFYEYMEPQLLLINRKYRGAVVLPVDLEANIYRGKQSNIGFVVDDTVAGGVANLRQGVTEVFTVENAAGSMAKLSALGLTSDQAMGLVGALSIQQRTPYNPALDYINTTVVGFVNLILMALLTMQTLTIVPRLRAGGQYPKAILSPLGIISRVIPYVAVFFVGTIFTLGVLKEFAGLRFAGSVLEFSLPLFLHLLASGLLGLFLGWTAKDPSKATAKAIIVIFPSFLLSNIVFPVALMPQPLQYLGKAFPLNWYAIFYQDIALRGAPLTYLGKELGGFLILLAAISLLLALIIIKELRANNQNTTPE